jgi:hypothetical protein
MPKMSELVDDARGSLRHRLGSGLDEARREWERVAVEVMGRPTRPSDFPPPGSAACGRPALILIHPVAGIIPGRRAGTH